MSDIFQKPGNWVGVVIADGWWLYDDALALRETVPSVWFQTRKDKRYGYNMKRFDLGVCGIQNMTKTKRDVNCLTDNFK